MAENLKYLNDNNFDEEIASGITIVDFYADWCGPCRMMEPVMEELASSLEEVKVAKFDIESSQAKPAALGVTSIPTIIIFKDGNEEKRIVGVKDAEELKALVAEL
ncbi:MAG: thioredoxin [Waddliaceae bacterium]